MIKFVQFDFQNPNIRAFDCYRDILEAVRYTRRNLDLRYKITLYDPLVTEDQHVYLKIEVPEGYNFSMRNLRGIAAYLLKHYPKCYKQYITNNRLFIFRDYTPIEPDDKLKQLLPTERSELVIKFICLLDRVDEDSLMKAKRIKDILEENNAASNHCS